MQIFRGRVRPTDGRESIKALVLKEQVEQCNWHTLGFAKRKMGEDAIIKRKGHPNF